MGDIALSPSQLSRFDECSMAYRFRYIDKRVPVTVEDKLAFGTLWDRTTQRWWEDGFEAAIEWLETQVRSGMTSVLDTIKIASLLRYYDPPDCFKLIESQVKVDVPIVNPETGEEMPNVRLRCMADSILENTETGRKAVREAKITTKAIDGYGPWWQVLQIDGQASAYWLAFDAEELIYDCTHKPQIKPSGEDLASAALKKQPGLSKKELTEAKKEITEEEQLDAYRQRLMGLIDSDPERWYQWRPIRKTKADAKAAQLDIWRKANKLLQCREDGLWTTNKGSCSGFYGTCAYIDVCSRKASLDSDALFMTPEWAIRHADEEKPKDGLPF